MDKLIRIVKYLRAVITRFLKPSDSYWTAVQTVEPLSTKFGFDRGTPIDRYWIESFLNSNKKFVKGKVLEITDNTYTRRYGGSKVKTSDVLDIDFGNKKANIHGDLRNLRGILPDNTYDCIILTHVLGQVDDISSAISELSRILKKEGVILVTSSVFSPTYDKNPNYWRFTPNGAKYLFGKNFKKVRVTSYGNVLAGQCFWAGMAQEEISKKALEFNDPRFPCVIGIIAKK